MNRTSSGGAGRDLNHLQNTPPWEWPEDTDDRLLAILNNGETPEADRLIAADLAGNFVVINDALAQKLLSILSDEGESDAMRAMSAISLGPVLEHSDIEGFEDSDEMPILEKTFGAIQTTLRTLYNDTRIPKRVRRPILEAAVRAPEEWHVEAVREAAASNDPEWRLTAVFCMGHIVGFEREIVEALSSTDPAIKLEAVRAAANWEIAEAEPHVVKLVNAEGTEKPLLLAAIEAVGYICGERAEDILSELVDSEDEEIAEAVEEALETAQGSILGDLDDA
jgi:uncharacterized protein (UPF0147 family)